MNQMGMDVFGNKPNSEAGEHFRCNVWGWHPLAKYCCEVAPDITSKCKHWHSNDADGLAAEDARQLAIRVQAEIDSGRAQAYAQRHASANAMLPNEPCAICAGTGTRKPVPELGAGNPNAGGIKCNGCDGSG
jgi:hypothetical protein